MPGRVDVQRFDLGRDDELFDIRGEQGVDVDVGRVLAAHHDRVQPGRPPVDVLDGDLGLPVGKAPGQPVRERDRQRHQLRGLVAGEAVHQALVTGALPVELVDDAVVAVLVGVVDTLGDIRRLGADRHAHPA